MGVTTPPPPPPPPPPHAAAIGSTAASAATGTRAFINRKFFKTRPPLIGPHANCIGDATDLTMNSHAPGGTTRFRYRDGSASGAGSSSRQAAAGLSAAVASRNVPGFIDGSFAVRNPASRARSAMKVMQLRRRRS